MAALEAQLAEASSRQGAQAERLHAAEAKTAALEARVRARLVRTVGVRGIEV